jgi:hypothetical protein
MDGEPFIALLNQDLIASIQPRPDVSANKPWYKVHFNDNAHLLIEIPTPQLHAIFKSRS